MWLSTIVAIGWEPAVLLVALIVVSTPSCHANPPFKIVHLGDSFSAGNGARAANGEQNYHSVPGCYRSPTNWGSQFAQSLANTYSVAYVNRACSNGVLKDITEVRFLDPVAVFPFFPCPSPVSPYEESYTKTSFLTCSHQVEPQINAIDGSVDLVLLTIGGNDAQFTNIIVFCFMPAFANGIGCKAAIDYANSALDSFGPKLVSTLAAIGGRLKPGAKIVLVAYPNLLPDVAYYVDGYYAAGSAIRDLAAKGDRVQRNAVDQANAIASAPYAIFQDGTKAVFNGHEPDPGFFAQNPNRWMNEVFESVHLLEWYHFNPLGHENLGRLLTVPQRVRSLGSGDGDNDTIYKTSIDITLIVDTTSSMKKVIAELKNNMAYLFDQLASATTSFRVAIVSFRDFSGGTGYSSRVDLDLTDDESSIEMAIGSLKTAPSGGGNNPASVFSGIEAALDLSSWNAENTIAVVISDSPPLLNNKGTEPISNVTASQLVEDSITFGPIKVYVIDLGGVLASSAYVREVTKKTGGGIYVPGTISEVTQTLVKIIDTAINEPSAWFGSEGMVGKIGTPIEFDAEGSYDPNDLPLVLFEWDFDGDGMFDLNTTEDVVYHTYDKAFDGIVVLRVTNSQGGTALDSSRITINTAGFIDQGDTDPCELDNNGISIVVGENGLFLNCKADHLGPTPAPMELPPDDSPTSVKPAPPAPPTVNPVPSPVQAVPSPVQAVPSPVKPLRSPLKPPLVKPVFKKGGKPNRPTKPNKVHNGGGGAPSVKFSPTPPNAIDPTTRPHKTKPPKGSTNRKPTR